MNADGRNVQRLTTDPGTDYRPAWLPDGQSIVFASTRSGDPALFVVESRGGDAVPIGQTDIAALVISAQGANYDIFLLNQPETGSIRRLTDHPQQDRDPVWSPDGKHIAFVSTRDKNREIYVMNADGTLQRNLTRNKARDDSPRWSPDGKRILFVSERDGNPEIYAMSPDGSALANITNDPDIDASPWWSPDQRLVAYLK